MCRGLTLRPIWALISRAASETVRTSFIRSSRWRPSSSWPHTGTAVDPPPRDGSRCGSPAHRMKQGLWRIPAVIRLTDHHWIMSLQAGLRDATSVTVWTASRREQPFCAVVTLVTLVTLECAIRELLPPQPSRKPRTGRWGGGWHQGRCAGQRHQRHERHGSDPGDGVSIASAYRHTGCNVLPYPLGRDAVGTAVSPRSVTLIWRRTSNRRRLGAETSSLPGRGSGPRGCSRTPGLPWNDG
jgi:hypothetical protein